MHLLKTKRIYEPYDSQDGYRILVDRLWPRGIKKIEAHIDQWDKAIAPSNALRKWFDHDSEKFEAFKARYLEEIEHNDERKALCDVIKEHLPMENVTLLYGAKDHEYNQAIILQEWLKANLDLQ